MATQNKNDSRLMAPKYILIVLVIAGVYSLLNYYTSGFTFLAWLVFLIVTYTTVSKLKATKADQITSSDKLKAVCFMAIDPIIAQAFYYYRLRKVHPNAAKSYNKLGWKILGLEIVFLIIAAIPYGFAMPNK